MKTMNEKVWTKIISEGLESEVSMQGHHESLDFTVTKTPGRMVFATFNQKGPGPLPTSVNLMFRGECIATIPVTGIEGELPLGPRDTGKVTYTVWWNSSLLKHSV